MKLTAFLKTKQQVGTSGKTQTLDGSMDQDEWYRKLKETVIQGWPYRGDRAH